MNKRRAVAILLIIVLALAFFTTWRSRKDEDRVSTTGLNENYKVYLITMDKTDQYWSAINQGAADMADLLGVTYKWDAPEEKDILLQIEIFNKAVVDGANLIMLAANDPVAIANAVKDAKAKNVLIIYVDSPAYEEAITTLSTDNYSAGITAARTMIMELEGVGVTSGSIGIIGVNTVTNSTLNRELGFRETMEADGRFRLLPTEYENGNPVKSKEVATRLIIENSDLVGLFGTNEGSTVGVGNAIKAIDCDIIGIGFDNSHDIQELIRDESLKAVVVQNPYTMGYLAMAQAFAALKGYDIGPPSINTGVSILKKRTTR